MTVHHPSPVSRRLRLAAFAALGVSALTLAGCGADGTQAAGAATETLVATADGGPITGSASAGPSALGSADLSMKTLRPEAPAQLVVTDVRVSAHSGFDRVVLDLHGAGDPGWFVDYTTSPTQQGSGSSISFTGDTALNVNVDGTVYPFDLGLDDPQIGTVPGTGGIVTEVISAGTFEGRSQFLVGLNGRHPYSVTVLEDPHRLVIDITAN